VHFIERPRPGGWIRRFGGGLRVPGDQALGSGHGENAHQSADQSCEESLGQRPGLDYYDFLLAHATTFGLGS
jgi:hypothetical protein